MPDSEGAHIARLEERIAGVREDVQDLMAEVAGLRKRLHDVEGIAGAFLEWQKQSREKEAAQYRRLGNRVAWLGLVVAVAAIVVPVIVTILVSR